MIFREDLAIKVMEGRKTVTRRLCNHVNDRSPWWVGKCGYKVGQVFAVNPGRGIARVGDARVLKVERIPLEHVGDEEARREGFEDERAFEDGFRGINGAYPLGASVWRLEIEAL